MSFTIPPSTTGSLSEKETREKLFASSSPPKTEEQRKDEMIAGLMARVRSTLDDNKVLTDLLNDRREIEEERGQLLKGMAQTIERQNAIILQQQRELQQPTGFKWLLSVVAALAMDCFFFLSRLMTAAAKNAKHLATYTWQILLKQCEIMVRKLQELEQKLMQARTAAVNHVYPRMSRA